MPSSVQHLWSRHRSTSRTLVSVIVQVFNRRGYIEQCLESLLNQTHAELDVLVVDDASTDGTSEVCARFASRDSRIRHVRFEQNKGLRRCRKETLGLAAGPYVAILDSDDFAHPLRLQCQLEAFERNPRLIACGTRFWIEDSRGFSLPMLWGPYTNLAIKWTMLFGNCWIHSSVMFSREVALRAGGYDERFTSGEDHELYSRLLALGEVATVRRPLVTWRRHPHNMTTTEGSTVKEVYSEIVQLNLARHCGLDVTRGVARALSFSRLGPSETTQELTQALRVLRTCAQVASSWSPCSETTARTIERLYLHALFQFWWHHHVSPRWPELRPRWRDAVRAGLAANRTTTLLDPGFLLNPSYMKARFVPALRDLALS